MTHRERFVSVIELAITLLARLIAAWRVLLGRSQVHDQQNRLPSGLPLDIAEEERLARFLKQKNQFSATKEIVKYTAFLPGRHDGKTSVFRHTGEPAEEFWEIGFKELGGEVTVYGAGIVVASNVREVGLDVNASEPPPRHANIEGWPLHEDPDLAKAARMEVAKVVAERASLLLRSP